MKTSEFGKKMVEEGFKVDLNRTAVTFSKDGLVIDIGVFEEMPSVAFDLTSLGYKTLTAKQWSLINSYLQTKPENRKDERKWVIPWGSDTSDYTQNMWRNQDRPTVTYEERKNWKSDKGYQFTDSELEHLKSTQSPAIAQAIDIAKELVTDE
ncbi:hypothetical protein [Furfurilactobacillus milii]|uniref:Uncharacterized protein n=1 Tax=Furfurilactobacillus milii TaxID=2888272 RepID=A0ABT6DCF1_9LACO|nr:hypothetical protein [Furfurilactobacillus milii]QLE66946.1 hypothetical protein LROSL2_1596 [Furfurilactobacillus rossiae]MCF6161956.1 hypothetical protein [Furfurilactobacillus milii]MCF6164336.1 hypothetical protein [Furfurilactobacillus milii]MDF9914824.1 hypothetical protein [Furfurilactobacillus milii]QLE69376.1 hypothetical protein LROSL3_1597 [Furfurilactobacillus rossiae]